MPSMRKHELTGGYQHMNYDIQLYGGMKSFLEGSKEYVKHSMATNLYRDIIVHEETQLESDGGILSVYLDSLNEVFNIIPHTLFIDYDQDLINKGQSIFISYSVANNTNSTINDKLKLLGQQFTVAGIFEDCVSRVINNSNVIILSSENPYTSEYEYFTFVYIKLKDYEKGLDYFDKNHLDFKNLFLKYGEDWQDVTPKQEIEENRKNSYFLRTTRHQEALNVFLNTRNLAEDIMFISLSIFALFTTNVYAYYKHAKTNMKKFAILRISGCPKRKYFIYYFAISLFEQLIILIITLSLLVKVNWLGRYISTAVVLSWFGILFTIMAIVSLFAGFVIMYLIVDLKLLQSLEEEKEVGNVK